MKVLHTVSGIWKHTGGPAEVIPLLCRYLLDQGAEVSIATLDGEFSDATLASKAAGVNLHVFPVRLRHSPWYSRAMRIGLCQLIHDVDIVHGNGLWEYTNWRTMSECLLQRKPYLISFHAQIKNPRQNWRIKHHAVWRLLAPYVKRASCLQACTQEELRDIRETGLRNPVAIIPNGVETWESLPTVVCHELVPEFKNHKTVLFLSRIHPGKGVYDLVKAWHSLDKIVEGWQLLIAGPGEPKHVEKLKNVINSQKRKSKITFLGPLYGEKRKAAYQACDVFVLPGYLDNFGIAVGEALACGKPVVATYGVPWPDLLSCQCGWWIPNGVFTLAIALREAMQASGAERSAMGQKGRSLILEKYSWSQVSHQMKQTYEWVLGGGSVPSWVDVA